MKNSLLILILLAAGCSKKPEAAVESAKPETKEMPTLNTSPVEYVGSLQKDANKANAVKDKANAAIQGNVQALDQVEKDSSGQ